jgi:hypothetical protein
MVSEGQRISTAAVSGFLAFVAPIGALMLLTACGSSGSSTTSGSSISTCGQYQSATRNSKMAFVKSIDTKVAINPNNSSYWVAGITAICGADGTPQSSIHQLLISLGYLGPGQ